MKKSERKGERKGTQQATRRRKRDVFIQKKWTGCIDTIHKFSIYIYVYILSQNTRLKKKKQKIKKGFAACARAHASVFSKFSKAKR